MNRRTVLTAAAWSVPAITVAAAAPAFASSTPTPPPVDCEAFGCKRPGEGQHTKDYYVHEGCAGTVLAVHIDGHPATLTDHGWAVYGLRDSRHALPVIVTTDAGTWTGAVAFPPCGTGADQ